MQEVVGIGMPPEEEKVAEKEAPLAFDPILLTPESDPSMSRVFASLGYEDLGVNICLDTIVSH